MSDAVMPIAMGLVLIFTAYFATGVSGLHASGPGEPPTRRLRVILAVGGVVILLFGLYQALGKP